MICMTEYNAVICMTVLALSNASEKSSVNHNTLVINYLYITNITRYIYPNLLHIYILLLMLLLLFGPFIPSRNIDEVFIITIYGSNVPSKPLSC